MVPDGAGASWAGGSAAANRFAHLRPVVLGPGGFPTGSCPAVNWGRLWGEMRKLPQEPFATCCDLQPCF